MGRPEEPDSLSFKLAGPPIMPSIARPSLGMPITTIPAPLLDAVVERVGKGNISKESNK